ncbi:MAG: helix-turn-helix domain-containing protein, partial [Candidatus Omnitrophica bacterium]|nr:helix-turn-helix domain-containing protein [Candidatus Omnitrophota bacterium]
SDVAMEYLMNYAWPGNIRELENAIERAVIHCKSDTLEVDLFPVPGPKGHPATIQPKNSKLSFEEKSEDVSEDLPGAVEKLEKKLIQEALRSNAGNQRKTAKALGVTERILGYKIKQYGLSCPH